MSIVSSQLDRQDKSIEALTTRKQVLYKGIDTQKEKVATLKKASLNAATSFNENNKRTRAATLRRRTWNSKADCRKIVCQRSNYIKNGKKYYSYSGKSKLIKDECP